MRIPLVVTIACVALASPAAPFAVEPGAAHSATNGPNLVARHADIADVVVSSIEGKPVQGRLLVKPVLRGERMTMLELHYQAGTKAPLHTHTHESLIYVISGRVKTQIGGDVYVLGPGDAARHPPGVLHTVEALVESRIIEVKSPPPDMTTVINAQNTP
jgi:quercetin dioxygenase-like cupin family protein